MKKMILGLLAVVMSSVVGCGFADLYPKDASKWTQEQRQSAPDKFAELVKQKLSADIDELKERIAAGSRVAAQLGKEETNCYGKLRFGEKAVREFMAAKKKGSYPVELFGREYNETQVNSQIMLIVDELKLQKTMRKNIKNTLSLLEKEKRELTLAQANNETKLKLLDAQVEIYKSRRVSREGFALLDECADLLVNNATCFAQLDPVVDLGTLMERSKNEVAKADAETDVEAFLASLYDENETTDEQAVWEGSALDDLEAFSKAEAKFEGKGKLPTTVEEDDVPEEPSL